MKPAVLAVLAVMLVVLGGVAVVVNRPDSPEPAAVREYVWSVSTDDVIRLAIELPDADQRLAWKRDDGVWYFDQPDGPEVDPRRWGNGIPLLVSGPAAKRPIATDVDAEQLKSFGLVSPTMLVDLELADATSIEIDVGDATLDRLAYYIRLRDSPNVYTVPESWYGVLERLVLEPPYPSPN